MSSEKRKWPSSPATPSNGHDFNRPYQSGIGREGLELHYQPIVTARTCQPRWYECLARLRDNDGTIIPASAFVGRLEATSQIVELDRTILVLAIEELSISPDVSLAVNVSGQTTTDAEWLGRLRACVQAEPDIGCRLMIEITETVALKDIDQTAVFTRAARDLGCMVALDDFGTGYNSLAYFKKLALDVVKIDGSLVLDVATSEKDRTMITAIQMIADSYGLQTVGEHVETADVAAMLAALGVDYLQGHLFGRPSAVRPWCHSATVVNEGDSALVAGGVS